MAFPEFWLYFLGVLFIAVTLWMPQGVVGLVKKIRGGRFAAGPPQGETRPLGGQRPASAAERGGEQS